MIYPKKNKLIYGFFRFYIPWIIRRNFYTVNFNPVVINPDKAVLLLANHFGWWDAFLLYDVFRKLTDKKLYVMVIEDTMQREWAIKYIGAFSVNKKPREIIASLAYATTLLADPKNLVLIFPQGKLYSNLVNEVHFEKGIIKIIDQAKDKFQLIYATTFIENFQHKKPTANIYLSANTNCTFEDIKAITGSYQQHYNTSRQQQTKIVL